MKWQRPTGSLLYSATGRYLVMHATSKWWVAYYTPAKGEYERIGERRSEDEAKTACDDHAQLRTPPAQAAPQS